MRGKYETGNERLIDQEGITDAELEERVERIIEDQGLNNFQEKLTRCAAAAMNLEKRANEAIKAIPKGLEAKAHK